MTQNENMPPKYKFLFSRDLVARREWCLRVVYTLGDAEHCNMGTVFDPTATHVIVGSLMNSTTLFCALAAGKWIISVKFLEDSQARGHWLDPGDYEVGSLRGREFDPEHPKFFVSAPQRCREEVVVRMKPLFATWNVGVLVYDCKARRSVRWILKAGGAEVKVIDFPVRKEDKPPRVNWIFAECPSRELLEGIQEWGIPLIPLSYLVDFLLKGHIILNRLTYPLRDCIHVDSSFLTRKWRQSFKYSIFTPECLTNASVEEDDAKMHDVSKRRLTIPKIRKKSRKLESDENSPVLHQNSNGNVSRLCLKKWVASLHRKSNGCVEIKDRPLTHLTVSNSVTVKDISSLSFSSVCSPKNGNKKCCLGEINSKSEINFCEDFSLTVESNASLKDSLTVESNASLKDSLTVESNASLKDSLTVESNASLKDSLTVESNASLKDIRTVESNVSLKDTSLLSCVGVHSEGNVDQESCVQNAVDKQDIDLHNDSSALGYDQVEDCSSEKVVNSAPEQALKSAIEGQESPLPSQLLCSIQESAKLDGDDSPCVNSEELLSSPQRTADYSPQFGDKQVHSESQPSCVQMLPNRTRCYERESQTHERVSEKYSRMRQSNRITSYFHPLSSSSRTFGRQNGKDVSSAPSNDVIDLISDDEFIEISSSDDDVIIVDPSDHATFAPTAPRSNLCPPTPSFLAPPYLCYPTGHPLHHLPTSSPQVALDDDDDDLVIVEGANLCANNIPHSSEVVHKTSLNQAELQQCFPKKTVTSSLDKTSSTLDKGKVSEGSVHPPIEILEVDEDELLNSTSFIEIDDDSSDSLLLSSDNSALSIASIHSQHCNEDVDNITPMETDDLGLLPGSNAPLELKVVNIPSRTDNLSPCHRSNALPELKVVNIPSRTDNLSPCHRSNALPELKVGNIPSRTVNLSPCHRSNALPELKVGNIPSRTDNLSPCHRSNALPELKVVNIPSRTDNLSPCHRSNALPELKVGNIPSRTDNLSPCHRSNALPELEVGTIPSRTDGISPISESSARSQLNVENIPSKYYDRSPFIASNIPLELETENNYSKGEDLSSFQKNCGTSELEVEKNRGSLLSDTDVNMNLSPVIGIDKSGMSWSPLKSRNDDTCANNKGINCFDSRLYCRSELPGPNFCNLYLNPPENVNPCVSVQCDKEENVNLGKVVDGSNGELICSTSGYGNTSPLPATDFINRREKCRARSYSSEHKREPCSKRKKRRLSTNLSEAKSHLNSRKGKSRTRENCAGKRARSVLACSVNYRVQDKYISSVSNCTSSTDLASPNEREENRVSHSVCVVAPVVEASTSSSERTAISAKDFRKIVHGYLIKFRSRPWLRMGASPQPPCTNSSTSCADYHGEGKVGATELFRHFNQMMIEMINDGFVLEAFQYCQCHISRTMYPGVKVIRSVMYLILNTDNLDVLVSAQLILRTLLELHPPCAYKMGAYYKQILLDSWTENGKKKSQGIFDDIISKLEEEINRTGEVNSPHPSVSALVDTEDGIKWTFMDADVEPAEHCYNDLSVSDRLRRLFIVFTFIVDVMERDLVVWLVKHGPRLRTHSMLNEEGTYPNKPSVLIKEETRPLIVSAIWTNAYGSLGSVSRICERLIKLYLKGFSSHQAKFPFKTFHKIFALIIEAMNAAEQCFSSKEILEYGQNCENMAKKFLEHIACADLYENDLIYMLKSLKPPWLPFYLCDRQIRNKLFTKDSASLATMRRYVEEAYNILQEECRSQDLQNDNVLHEPKKQNISQFTRKDNKGEVKLHKVCRGNRVEELKKILNSGMEIDVNAPCYEGWTPLHEAVNHGHVECVKELLNYRAPQGCENVNLRARSNNGTTPLIDAVENERVEVCRLLIAYGGQELLQDKRDGKSPLEIAHMFCPENEAILHILESACSQSKFFRHLSIPEVKKIVAILPVMISSYIEFRYISGIEFKLSYASRSPSVSPHRSSEVINVDLLAVKKDLVEFRELRRSVVNLYKNNMNCMFLRNIIALFLSSNGGRM